MTNKYPRNAEIACYQYRSEGQPCQAWEQQQAEIVTLKALLQEWLNVTHPGPSRDLQLRTEKVLNDE
jgi:hypothetical protein